MISLPRLYAILDIDTLAARGLDPRATWRAWLDAGVRLIQLRAKHLAAGPLLDLAAPMAADAHAAGAMFIVNDRADIARAAGADGVHLGQEDLTPAQVRGAEAAWEGPQHGRAPARLRVGLSTHSVAQLRAALAQPADYFAIGPVFPTASKQNADPVVGLETVREAASVVAADGRPLVAIGGITCRTAPAVLAAGASSVAVISSLLDEGPSRWVASVAIDH